MKNLTLLEGSNSFWILKNVYNLQNFQQLANAKTEMSKWVSKRFPIAELSHGISLQMKSGIVPLFQNKKIEMQRGGGGSIGDKMHHIFIRLFIFRYFLIFLTLSLWRPLSLLMRQKGESQNGSFKKTKDAKFSKQTFLTPLYAQGK